MRYFDVTNLIAYSHHTHNVSGIQRVTLEAMRGLGDQITPFFVVPITNQWYCIRGMDCSTIADLEVFRHLWTVAALYGATNVNNYRAYTRKYICRGGRYVNLAKLFMLALRIPFANKILTNLARKVLVSRQKLQPPPFHMEPLPAIEKDDTLCLFGGTWNHQHNYESLLKAIPSEAKRVFLIYDIIPLVCPYVPDHLRDAFRVFIPWVLDEASQIIVNSDSCKNDLLAIAKHYGKSCPPIVKAQLSHRMPSIIEAGGDPQSMPLQLRKLIPETFALCVGSIESRKNHLNLLITWAKFVRSEHYMNQKLVIAGRWSWDVERVQNFLHETGHVFGSVIVIEAPSDVELQHLYRLCRFTVFPSHYEGWGLPIGESLSFGKPCLTFDSSSLKEAGAGLSHTVEAYDYKNFYKLFVQLMCDEEYYASAVKTITKHADKLRSWGDFSADIHEIFSEQAVSVKSPARQRR